MRRLIFFAVLLASAFGQQTPGVGIPTPTLGPGPFIIDTAEQHKVKISIVARGIPHPFSLAFLPNGDMLVSERAGKLRLIRGGVLQPEPVAGLPAIRAVRSAGLLDIAPDPKFAQNNRIYFTYSKPSGTGMDTATVLARARWTGSAFADVEDLLVGAVAPSTSGARIAFGRDGMLYVSTGAPFDENSQAPGSLYGKILRLTMDGKPAPDNPFVGKAGYRPEIYTMGHRDQLGLTVHPDTGAVLAVEHGPNGGDEVNLIQAGKNYGWPLLSYGRNYDGPRVAEHGKRDVIEGRGDAGWGLR